MAENPTNSAKKMASEVPLSSAKIPMLATRLPSTMPGASRFTMSQRTAPRLWWAYTLESDVNMIVAIDVAIAILTVRSEATPCLPRMKVINGTISMPPPIPSSPARKPEPRPSKASSRISKESMCMVVEVR